MGHGESDRLSDLSHPRRPRRPVRSTHGARRSSAARLRPPSQDETARAQSSHAPLRSRHRARPRAAGRGARRRGCRSAPAARRGYSTSVRRSAQVAAPRCNPTWRRASRHAFAARCRGWRALQQSRAAAPAHVPGLRSPLRAREQEQPQEPRPLPPAPPPARHVESFRTCQRGRRADTHLVEAPCLDARGRSVVPQRRGVDVQLARAAAAAGGSCRGPAAPSSTAGGRLKYLRTWPPPPRHRRRSIAPTRAAAAAPSPPRASPLARAGRRRAGRAARPRRPAST
eukprot:5555005-Prymnesium_polylepis.1